MKVEYYKNSHWFDKGTYWHLVGPPAAVIDGVMFVNAPPPTTKRVHYAEVTFESGVTMKLAVGVWDDNGTTVKYRKLNREEFARLVLTAKSISLVDISQN